MIEKFIRASEYWWRIHKLVARKRKTRVPGYVNVVFPFCGQASTLELEVQRDPGVRLRRHVAGSSGRRLKTGDSAPTRR